MDVVTIDHVNLQIHPDSVEETIGFYRRLGFEIDGLDEFRAAELPVFDARLDADHVIHLWPDESFTAPSGDSFDHVALVVDAPFDQITASLDDADVEIEETNPDPRGASGWEPSVYVRDPSGYRVELKQHRRHSDFHRDP
jgi:catechol 2,3-dioxygenase-like lactoylglutathione lyase family enzyme